MNCDGYLLIYLFLLSNKFGCPWGFFMTCMMGVLEYNVVITNRNNVQGHENKILCHWCSKPELSFKVWPVKFGH